MAGEQEMPHPSNPEQLLNTCYSPPPDHTGADRSSGDEEERIGPDTQTHAHTVIACVNPKKNGETGMHRKKNQRPHFSSNIL